ncbi:sec-independent translocase [uncultured Tessaracoccus sp.]|uniref:sec-independent translocase n=1 Tax=uncultured Tessaracoccus sp. TaxID=905023 RepID=UPI00261FA82B|nr:sec-independent translocase [uncultured Tessaracoccus sp.]
MFGIDAVELVLILVLAVLLFGPEKLPQFSRKAARVYVYLRGIANNTQNTLRDQLGPEYADLELADLNPKAFVKKHLSQEVAAIEEAKREIEEMRQQLEEATQKVESEVDGAKEAAHAAVSSSADAPAATWEAPPFDDEAT